MQINEYQDRTAATAIYPSVGEKDSFEFAYLTLGLVGEAGEVAEKIKKFLRDNVLDKELIKKELGDVFWYLARLCTAFDVSCSEVLEMNYEKLMDRKNRGVLGGNGDKR